MNRVVRLDTLCSQVAKWLFIVSLFCDQADVNDVIGSAIVVHVEDACFASFVIHSVKSTALCGKQCARGGNSGAQAWFPLSQTRIRLLIDEDSPSVAPLQYRYVNQPFRIPIFSAAIFSDDHPPSEILYILFRSLLI